MALGDRLSKPLIETVVSSGITIGYGQNSLNFIGEFVAGNTFDLTINGVAIVQVPFATDHETTMRNIATSITNHAATTAYVVKSGQAPASKILIEGVTAGLALTYTALTIAGGATRPAASFEPTSSGSLQEKPALYVLDAPGGTAKIERIQGAANYTRTFAYAAAFGAPGGENITSIVHTGTTAFGAETVTETISYVNALVDGQQITTIVYS